MGARRRVEVSDLLRENARRMFPSGGSTASGNPGYELFETGPLAAARLFFAHRFDQAPEAVSGIKVWVTIDLPYFPPMAFYAAMVGDHIELLDVTIEKPQDYWSMIEDDSDD